MLDFESCLSLEKLVADNEICGMAYRLIDGIEPKDDFPSLGIFQELLREKHLLISEHTRKHLKKEHFVPGLVIDRTNRTRWQQEGALSFKQRVDNEVKKLLESYEPSDLPENTRNELIMLMKSQALLYDQEKLPDIPYQDLE